MNEAENQDRWGRLVDSIDRLSEARSEDAVIGIIRSSARLIAGADGITFVRREGDRVAYIAEDAISPLWTGQRFPILKCISGIAMVERRPVIIPDIRVDPRVPLNAYLATFVQSMAMFPVGVDEPVASIGAYWREAGEVDAEAIELMTALARSTAAVMDTLFVREAAEERRRALGGR